MKIFFLCSTNSAIGEVDFRNSHLQFQFRCVLISEISSVLNELNDGGSSDELLCVVHESVVLPTDFEDRLRAMKDELDREWPNWKLAGDAGVTPLRYGLSAQHVVDYSASNVAGPNLAGQVIPAQGLSGHVLVFRSVKLGARHLKDLSRVDDLGITVPVRILGEGGAVLVAPHLSCFVDTTMREALAYAYEPSAETRVLLFEEIANSELQTYFGTVALFESAHSRWADPRMDLPIQCLRNAATGRKRRTLTIITRTRFRRTRELQRLLVAVSQLRSRMKYIDLDHVLMSGSHVPPDLEIPAEVSVIVHEGDEQDHDDRFELITRGIQATESDFVWFVDDDDWVFPMAAEKLELVIETAPAGSTLFFDSQQFFPTNASEPADPFDALHVGSRVHGREFALSAIGLNRVPFPNVIFHRSQVSQIPRELVEKVSLYEDFALQIMVMASPQFFPIAEDLLIAGVQMKDESASNDYRSRKPWNQSMSNLISFLTSSRDRSVYLSTPAAGASWFNALNPAHFERLAERERVIEDLGQRIASLEGQISQLESVLELERERQVRIQEVLASVEDALKAREKAHAESEYMLSLVTQSKTWRWTRPLRRLRKGLSLIHI